jgi:hypothetical protein
MRRDWHRTSTNVLVNDRLGAGITRNLDKFVVQVGPYSRDCETLWEAMQMARMMDYEIKRFEAWENPRKVAGATALMMSKNLVERLQNRAMMAVIMVGIGAIIGRLFG